MRNARSGWPLLAATAGFLAVGVPYWLIPYNKVNLPSALPAGGLLLVAALTLLLRAWGVASLRRAIAAMGASVVAAVLVRVLVEGVRDPTSHNLWPLEVVIASAVGFACSAAGAIAGSLIAMLARHFAQRGE